MVNPHLTMGLEFSIGTVKRPRVGVEIKQEQRKATLRVVAAPDVVAAMGKIFSVRPLAPNA